MSPTTEISNVPGTDTWIRMYGEKQESTGSDVIQADDGGFFIVGGTSPFKDVGQPGGVLLIKTDAGGEYLWEKVFGGKGYDVGMAIARTKDNNYLIAGVSSSFGEGDMDAYLIKVDQQGKELWSKTYGSFLDEMIFIIQATADGGYLLVGNIVDPKDFISDPGAAGYAGLAGRSNIFMLKIGREGNELWTKTYQSEKNVLSSSARPTTDGNFIILATILYYPSIDNDILLLKVDARGNEIWSRTWEQDALAGYDLLQTSDNNYLITGVYETSDKYGSDMILIMVDGEGNELWRYTFGDQYIFETGHDIVETPFQSFVVLGNRTESLYSGDSYVLLISVNREGNLLWAKELDFMQHFKSYKLTTFLQHPDGGYVITGSGTRKGSTFNTILIKTDANGFVSE